MELDLPKRIAKGLFELRMLRQEFMETQKETQRPSVFSTKEAYDRLGQIIKELRTLDQQVCSLMLQFPFQQLICGEELAAVRYRDDGTPTLRFEPLPEQTKQLLRWEASLETQR